MGNRMARKAVVVGEPEKKNEAPREEGKSGLECRVEGTKQRKAVRFRVDGEDEGERRKGVVRIRLVVTREELRQILNGESSAAAAAAYSSSEELLAAIKLGSRRSSRILRMDDHQPFSSSGDMKLRKWRPALESIPEF